MTRRLDHLKFKVALLAAGAWHTAQWWGTRRREAGRRSSRSQATAWCNGAGVMCAPDGTPIGDCQECLR